MDFQERRQQLETASQQLNAEIQQHQQAIANKGAEALRIQGALLLLNEIAQAEAERLTPEDGDVLEH